MNHLQEAVRTHFSALTSLKQQAAQYREEKETAEKTAEELRNKYQELTANTSLMQDKLRLYSGDHYDTINIMM
jgi:predicted ribosome quality control (RQC) complex YloA/Tae2 family protein